MYFKYTKKLKCPEMFKKTSLKGFAKIPKAEFLNATGTDVLKVFLLAIHSHIY